MSTPALPEFDGPGYGSGAPGDGLRYLIGSTGEYSHAHATPGDRPPPGTSHTHLIDGKRWAHDHDGPFGASRNASPPADDTTED